ncbi:hypothetical protein [Caballeronia sp. LZ035]|uniref:hypothetical protein n=1 Tax=Caballeronia sp. LZ035 TaxID=3038568 RepID=UPI00286252E2|nr:hypothetical protein [Caballeronia sp. LZ035]MDR5763265.1 hypothetical protein [Caballeronia sp. LZ035]
MKNDTAPVQSSDAEIRATLIAQLKEYGPTRAKTLTKRAGVPYGRIRRVLEAARATGELNDCADESWGGYPMKAWAVTGSATVQKAQASRFAFSPSETLAEMQVSARATLMRGMA